MALSNFGRAFRDARASGQKTFTWNGKKYTTELKEEKAAREAKPVEKMRTAAEEAADDAKIAAAMKKSEPKKEAKKETEAIVPMPPLKKPASKPRTRVETKAEVRKAPSLEGIEKIKPSPDPYGKKPPTWGDEPKAKEPPKRQPNVWSNPRGGGGMGGSLDPYGSSSPKGLRREPRFASGGSVKSASSRGDGCAMRGKTRGKVI